MNRQLNKLCTGKEQMQRLKNLVYVDEKDFEGEEELCNALVSFIGRWKKKKLAECEQQRQAQHAKLRKGMCFERVHPF